MTGLDPLIGRREIAGPDDMEAFGERMGGMLRPGDLVVLTGALGAGKTTLTRGIAAGLGVRGPVQSPTFVIARTHPSLVGGAPLVHVDAYRLGSALELDDLDIDVDRSVVIVECWNTFGDLGAAIRSSDYKVRELGEAGLLWVVRDTRANRELVGRYGTLLDSRFIGSSVGWVRALVGEGEMPGRSGLVWCDVKATRVFARRR